MYCVLFLSRKCDKPCFIWKYKCHLCTIENESRYIFQDVVLIDGCLQLKYKISPFDEADTVIYISSAEKQKGAINSVQRRSIENQKGAISIDFVQQ